MKNTISSKARYRNSINDKTPSFFELRCRDQTELYCNIPYMSKLNINYKNVCIHVVATVLQISMIEK